MCGICGIVYDDRSQQVEREALARMNRTMVHRGPDDEGYYVNQNAGIAMRRLSIIDVAGGHQPLSSEDGQIQAVCNGELYNFRQIKLQLESRGHRFKTRTDVEIVPHLYEECGADLVKKISGMFGLCVWDAKNRTLMLARDRMGKKSIYWSHSNGVFLFGSELKAVLAYRDAAFNHSRESIAKYLAYEYVPAPHTIFEGVQKLEPGYQLILKDGKVELRRYWDEPLGEEYSDIKFDDAREKLISLLSSAVEKRLVSDVPLGVFLSGGIDSSTVVAMMSRHMKAYDIKTFSISFKEKSFDESSHARRVASHFGTDHKEQVCTPDELLALLPRVNDLLDEPFADASIIPTFALSLFTRQSVTVALGGDGGDELFAGYPTFQAEKFAGWYQRIPGFARRRIIEPLAALLPVSDENISFDFKVKKFLKGAELPTAKRHMVWMGAFSSEELDGLLAFEQRVDVFEDAYRHASDAMADGRGGNEILYLYKKLYLAEDILTKVDRASMGASLEARAPLLDHELVEFVARLPYSMKLRGLTMKHILKETVSNLLPEGIARRPKKGFGIPVAKWIKGPLKEMTCDLLAADKLRREAIFRPEAVSQLLAEHFSGKADHRQKLWSLLMFEKWLERWGGGPLAM